jgi:hypothetical protein
MRKNIFSVAIFILLSFFSFAALCETNPLIGRWEVSFVNPELEAAFMAEFGGKKLYFIFEPNRVNITFAEEDQESDEVTYRKANDKLWLVCEVEGGDCIEVIVHNSRTLEVKEMMEGQPVILKKK